MKEKLWTGRLIANLIAIAVTLAIGWSFVYYFAIRSLTANGAMLVESVAKFNLSSVAWWRDLIALLFDILIIIISIIGSWWVLGHFAVEAREVGKWRKYYNSEEGKRDVWVRRFTAWQRVQHIWMIITFVISAYTGLGLVLRFYTSRADFIVWHVVSGIAMGVLVIIHFLQYTVEAILAKQSGVNLREKYPMLEIYSKKFFKSLTKALLHTVSPRVKPEPYGKYDPEQLFEYWGIYWGMAVLGVPGLLMLLFGRQALDGLLWVMHTKEAILAISFLIIVHMGYTHFRPKVFPMDVTFITGKMPMKRVKEEHPLWAEQLEKRGELKEAEVETTVEVR